MATNRKQPQRKQAGENKRTDLNPLKLPPDTRKRQEIGTDVDELVEGEDLPSDPPRSATSAIRYRQPSGSLRKVRKQESDPDTTRQQILNPPRRTGQASGAVPGPIRVRAGRNTTFDIPSPQKTPRRQSMHWLLYVGVGMIAALALWVT